MLITAQPSPREAAVQNSTTLRLLTMRVSLTVTARVPAHLRRPYLTPRRQRMQLLSITVPLLVMERLALRNLAYFPAARLTPRRQQMALLSTMVQRSAARSADRQPSTKLQALILQR